MVDRHAAARSRRRSAERQLAQYPLETIQPAIRAFWDAYAAARGLSGAARPTPSSSAPSAMPARACCRRVYESMAWASALTQQAVWQMQACINILRQPRAAATDLLGFVADVHA